MIILRIAGIATLLIIALAAYLVIRANPHGAASLLQHASHQVGSYASQAASRLPSPKASP